MLNGRWQTAKATGSDQSEDQHKRDLLFTDGCTLNASNKCEMQSNVDFLSAAYKDFILTIRAMRTKVMLHHNPGKPFQEPDVTLKGCNLKAVRHFCSPSNTLSNTASSLLRFTNELPVLPMADFADMPGIVMVLTLPLSWKSILQ